MDHYHYYYYYYIIYKLLCQNDCIGSLRYCRIDVNIITGISYRCCDIIIVTIQFVYGILVLSYLIPNESVKNGTHYKNLPNKIKYKIAYNI